MFHFHFWHLGRRERETDKIFILEMKLDKYRTWRSFYKHCFTVLFSLNNYWWGTTKGYRCLSPLVISLSLWRLVSLSRVWFHFSGMSKLHQWMKKNRWVVDKFVCSIVFGCLSLYRSDTVLRLHLVLRLFQWEEMFSKYCPRRRIDKVNTVLILTIIDLSVHGKCTIYFLLIGLT